MSRFRNFFLGVSKYDSGGGGGRWSDAYFDNFTMWFDKFDLSTGGGGETTPPSRSAYASATAICVNLGYLELP